MGVTFFYISLFLIFEQKRVTPTWSGKVRGGIVTRAWQKFGGQAGGETVPLAGAKFLTKEAVGHG